MKLQKQAELHHELQSVKTAQEADHFTRKYADLRKALKLVNADREQVNLAGEAYLRHQRHGGEILIRMAESGERATKAKGRPKKESHGGTLPEMGITKNKSSRWQSIARIPEEEFEAWLAENTDGERELIPHDFLRLALRKAQLEKVEAIKRAGKQPVPADKQIISDLSKHTGMFKTIYADPPWAYRDTGFYAHTQLAVSTQYPTLEIDELIDLYAEKVKALAHPAGAHLWLWTTWPIMRDRSPLRFLDACGFEWRSEIIWDKQAPVPSHWIMKQTELLILATRGKAPRMREDLHDLVSTKKEAKHSKKPREFYQLIESFSAGPYLELFARPEEKRSSWFYHGYEASAEVA